MRLVTKINKYFSNFKASLTGRRNNNFNILCIKVELVVFNYLACCLTNLVVSADSTLNGFKVNRGSISMSLFFRHF